MRRAAMMMTAAILGCDTETAVEVEDRRLVLQQKPKSVICEEEQPITSDDYCPTAIIRACMTPQSIPAIPANDLNPRPAPGTFGNIDPYVNVINTDYDACMASDTCFSPGWQFLEHSCCSARMHWGWLQARRTCFRDYGVGALYFSDGPCRRYSLDLECQMECWDQHADCYQDGNLNCVDAFLECHETCEDAYANAVPGQPWWNYPGPWQANEYGG